MFFRRLMRVMWYSSTSPGMTGLAELGFVDGQEVNEFGLALP